MAKVDLCAECGGVPAEASTSTSQSLAGKADVIFKMTLEE